MEYYNKAIEINPDYAESYKTYNNMAILFWTKRRGEIPLRDPIMRHLQTAHRNFANEWTQSGAKKGEESINKVKAKNYYFVLRFMNEN